MTNVTFDTLDYFEKLKEAGVPEAQAKVQVEVMQSVVQNYDAASRKELTTKADLQAVESRLETKLADTKHELIKWLVGALLAQTALLVAIMAIMK